jgi:hypothetical protein
MIDWELSRFLRFVPVDVLSALIASLALSFRSRAALQLEILALRHQLGVLHRSVKRPKLTSSDRLLWIWLRGTGPIGDQHSSSSNRKPSSRGIARASGCSGRGRFAPDSQGGQRCRKTSAS